MGLMNEDQSNCLNALEGLTLPNGEFCTPFKPIQDLTLLDRSHVRRAVRALARKGFAEYFKGLTTEDGDFVGAGYCITKLGIERLFND